MKKRILFLPLVLSLLLINTENVMAQKYLFQDSKITFFSEALVENITATTTEGKGLVDLGGRKFLLRIPIKTFTFEKELMQEHFNENYMESDTYPNGVFKGTIKGAYDAAADGAYEVTFIGVLDIHGVKKEREVPVKIMVKGGALSVESKFMVVLEEHDIERPAILFKNIAEEVEVTVEGSLKSLKK